MSALANRHQCVTCQGDIEQHGSGDKWHVFRIPTTWSTIEAHYDLQSGRYVAQGFDNTTAVNTFDVEMQASQYTPQALRTRGRR